MCVANVLNLLWRHNIVIANNSNLFKSIICAPVSTLEPFQLVQSTYDEMINITPHLKILLKISEYPKKIKKIDCFYLNISFGAMMEKV